MPPDTKTEVLSATVEKDPFAALDSRRLSTSQQAIGTHVVSLEDADEALSFLENHPNATEVAARGAAILEDEQARKKLVRKIDMTIAPLLAAVYFFQFLDKTTLNYTAVMGLRTDTKLVGQQYSDLSMLFYIGFLVAEFPTQYLAQRISRLGLYLGINIMAWGLILGFHAACHDFAGLAIVRTLLGVFESCVAPILVLIIAMWYKKEEQGTRISWFYVCNSLTQVFGGCIAYGVTFTKGHFASWRIFYIVIGALTMVIGLLVAIFLPDSPVKALRFTDAEKVAVLLRVRNNQSGTQNARLKKSQVYEAFKDVRTWLVVLSVLLSSIPNGGLSNFSSILLTTFGYTSQQALILGVPSGAVGAISVLGVGYLSDRWRDRSSVMLLCVLPCILAAGLMIGLDPNGHPINKPGLLAASWLSNSFGAAFMLLLAWNASNIAGHSKKVTCNALTMVAFCVGNIIGAQTFVSTEAPGYISGKASIVATLSVLCFVVLGLRYANDRLNRQNARKLEGLSDEQEQEIRNKMAFSDETDRKNPFFVYTH